MLSGSAADMMMEKGEGGSGQGGRKWAGDCVCGCVCVGIPHGSMNHA